MNSKDLEMLIDGLVKNYNADIFNKQEQQIEVIRKEFSKNMRMILKNLSKIDPNDRAQIGFKINKIVNKYNL